MRRDRHDRDRSFAWTIVPENPPGCRRVVLDIGLPDLLSVGALDRLVLVALQARMPRIRLQESQALPDFLQLDQVYLILVKLKRPQLLGCFRLEDEIESQRDSILVIFVRILSETPEGSSFST